MQRMGAIQYSVQYPQLVVELGGRVLLDLMEEAVVAVPPVVLEV
jgi:hypothetical protein